MNKAYIFILLLFFGSAGYSQQTHELTVAEAVDLAFKNVIELKNAQLDYESQVAKNHEIEGQAYPQLSGNVGANHYLKLPAILFPDATSTAIYQILKDEGVSGASGPITNVPKPGLRQVSFQQPWNFTMGATLSQLLFQPDVFVGLKARQTALDLSKTGIEQVREKIKDSAYKRYYAILIVQKQLYFLNEGVKRLEKLYHDDSIMYKNGFAERLDLDKVQVQLNNLNTTVSTLKNALDISYAALKFAIGIPQQDIVILKENLTTESVKQDILDADFKYEDRPEIRSLTLLKRLMDLDVQRYRMGYYPTVAAVGNYTVNGMGQKFFTSPNTIWLNSSYVGLNISVPIFDGFQRKNKILEARIAAEKAQNNLTNVKQAIDFEQHITKGSLQNALYNLDVQERNMQLAEKVYNGTKLKFQEGLGSSFEVLQADADMQQAQANYFNALYNAIVARVSYLYSLGKLK